MSLKRRLERLLKAEEASEEEDEDDCGGQRAEACCVLGLEGLCALGQALVRELSACKVRHYRSLFTVNIT